MEASIVNQFSEHLPDTTPLSRVSYAKLLSAYAALPFVTIETIAGIRSDDVGEVPVSFVRYAPPGRQASRRLRILVTAGIHGDESAGVLALYRYLLSVSLRHIAVDVYAFPCVNPVGLVRNSRLSSGHFDLNRQMTRNSIAPEVRAVIAKLESLAISFDAAFDLHENNPAAASEMCSDTSQEEAFNLYESNFDPLRDPIGTRVTRAVAGAGIAVSSQRTIYGEPALHGVIQRGIERNQIFDLERFMTMNYTNHVITSETPLTACLKERIRAHTVVLEAGVRSLG